MNLLDVTIGKALGSGSAGRAAETAAAVSGTTPRIAAEDRTLYLCGDAVTALTVTSLPASGLFEIVFACGAAAPQVTLPANVLLPDGVRIEADKIYDISIRVCSVDGTAWGLAAVQGWSVPSAAAE